MRKLTNKMCVMGLLVVLGPQAWSQETIYHWDGEAGAGSTFGASIALAGDTDKDGTPDVLITDWAYSANTGKVYLYSGRTGLLLGTVTGTSPGDALATVAGIGDVNQDSFDDFLIGASRIDQVYVYSGKNLDLLDTLWGSGYGSFGSKMASLGDVTGDGIPDVVISDSGFANFSPYRKTGRAYSYSGADGNMLETVWGEWEYGYFSQGLTSAGDLNDDGCSDFVATAENPADGSHRVYSYSGKDGGPIWQFDSSVTSGGAPTVADAGDVDLDGVNDLIVGDRELNGGAGAAVLYSGRTHAVLFSFVGDLSGPWQFGMAVAGVGDVNGDGVPDVLIGAPWQNGPNSFSGHAFLYSGRTGMLLYEFIGTKNVSEVLGSAVAGVGDLNQDGLADFAIGAPGHRNGGSQVGGAWVYAGNDLFLQGELDPTGRILTLHTRGGPPSGAAAVFLTKVSSGNTGGPRFVKHGWLDVNGNWSFSLPVPPTLWGYKLTFQAFASDGRSSLGSTPTWIDSGAEKVIVPP